MTGGWQIEINGVKLREGPHSAGTSLLARRVREVIANVRLTAYALRSGAPEQRTGIVGLKRDALEAVLRVCDL